MKMKRFLIGNLGETIEQGLYVLLTQSVRPYTYRWEIVIEYVILMIKESIMLSTVRINQIGNFWSEFFASDFHILYMLKVSYENITVMVN